MTENVTTPARQESVVSMLGKSRGIQNVCAFFGFYQTCCVCTHIFSWKTLSVICTVGLSANQAAKLMLTFSTQ